MKKYRTGTTTFTSKPGPQTNDFDKLTTLVICDDFTTLFSGATKKAANNDSI